MAIRTEYKHGQFAWIDLVARDINDARQFYRDLFGWKCVDVDAPGGSPYSLFQLEDKNVAGVAQMSEEMLNRDMPSNWNSYINVDDIDEVCAKTEELGGRVLVPVMDVLESGKLAFIEDPTHAQVGLWQKGTHFGAELTQDFHCFSWNELMTRNIQAACDFYGQLLGWEFVDYEGSDAKYFVVHHQGEETSGLMEMDERWGEMPPRWMIYFAVQSVDLTVDYVRQLGGFVQVHPYDIPEGRLSMVADLHGGVFDVVEMVQTDEDSA